MKKQTNLSALLSLLLVLLVTSGCASAEPAGLTEGQVTSLTADMLKALDVNDYQAFTRDFSEKMIAAFPPDQVTQLQALISSTSGKFISIGTPTLMNNQGYAIYRFPCKYENETVYVTVTFLIGGQKAEGLFFDSTALRNATQ